AASFVRGSDNRSLLLRCRLDDWIGQFERYGSQFVAATHFQLDLVAGPIAAQDFLEGIDAHNRKAVHVDDQIVGLQLRLGSRRAGNDLFDVGWGSLNRVGNQHDAVVTTAAFLRLLVRINRPVVCLLLDKVYDGDAGRLAIRLPDIDAGADGHGVIN